jgi:hypothetical protein
MIGFNTKLQGRSYCVSVLQVDLFTKMHPTFVSDTTPTDVDMTIRFLMTMFDPTGIFQVI